MKQTAISIRSTVKTLRAEADKLEKIADGYDAPPAPKPRKMAVKRNSKTLAEMSAAEKRRLAPFGGKKAPKRKTKGKLSSGG